MTVGIVTLVDSLNFGNRLQNYAVQTFLNDLGVQTQSIPYREALEPYSLPKRWMYRTIHSLLRFTAYEKKRAKRIALARARRTYSSTFTDEYICTAPVIRYRKLPKNFAAQYDYFLAGSDQVWHCWKNDRRELEFFLLMFAKPQQRLTMAPSFGFEQFPQKHKETFRKGLQGFEHLTVREERGAELIKELTGKEATVLLDPTMLIQASQWRKILKKPSQYLNDAYIFVYALGGFQGEVREKTRKLADELNLQVIDILDSNSDYYIHTRPDEFLYWIDHAQLVVTDSFHAVVFSILFEKPFVVTERSDLKGMESRFDTLFHKFGISGRRFDEHKDGFDRAGEARDKLFAVDYTAVPAVLEAERKRAVAFYRMCLGVEKPETRRKD